MDKPPTIPRMPLTCLHPEFNMLQRPAVAFTSAYAKKMTNLTSHKTGGCRQKKSHIIPDTYPKLPNRNEFVQVPQ